MKIFHPKNQKKAKQIGFIEAKIIHRKGLHDGELKLPRQDESGEWTSPYMQRELSAFREHTNRMWLQVEVNTSELQIQAEKLRQKIIRMKDNRRSISGNLGVRYTGEENLDSWIVQGRRSKELSEIEHLEDNYHEIVQQIVEAENATRLFCLQIEEHTFGRLSIYWDGCLSNHNANLPPVPTIIHSDAETAYINRHIRSLLPTSIAEQNMEEEEYYG
jgi:hypothetical protein